MGASVKRKAERAKKFGKIQNTTDELTSSGPTDHGRRLEQPQLGQTGLASVPASEDESEGGGVAVAGSLDSEKAAIERKEATRSRYICFVGTIASLILVLLNEKNCSPFISDCLDFRVLGLTRLTLGNLPYSATEEALRKHFAKAKPIGVRLRTDKSTGRCKGFAFLEFADRNAQQSCLLNYHHSRFWDSGATRHTDDGDQAARESTIIMVEDKEATGKTTKSTAKDGPGWRKINVELTFVSSNPETRVLT